MNRRSEGALDDLFERKIKPWGFHKNKTARQPIVEAEKVDKDSRKRRMTLQGGKERLL